MPTRPSRKLLLAGDIGGTNARLRLYDGSLANVVDEAVFPSRSAPSLAAIVRPYLAARKAKISAAVFGIAGPVIGGVVRATNLPWKTDEKRLARELGIFRLKLVNDLAAVALGAMYVGKAARKTIASGRAVAGANMAVISAGTGLGEALLVWDGSKYLPIATEGGHSDFGPNSDVESDLLSYWRRHHEGSHVSAELLLSGPGLGRIYDFFSEGRAKESAAVRKRLAEGDRNAAIAELGLTKESRTAALAVDLFAQIYGAEAGNLVLKGLAVGGLYVCGNIAAQVLPPKKSLFLGAMRQKGRVSELLSRTPVTLVNDRFVGLVGAGHLAARLAAE